MTFKVISFQHQAISPCPADVIYIPVDGVLVVFHLRGFRDLVMRSGLSAWRRQWKLLIWCGRASDWWCWWRTRRLHHAILMSTRHCDAAAGDDWCYVAIPTEFSVNEPKTVMPLQHAFFIFSIEMLAMKQVWRKIHRRGRPPNCHFLPGPHLTRGSFFGPTRVYIPNGTLIIRFCI